LAAGFADFVDGADVGVVQRRRRAGFAQQARASVSVGDRSFWKDLERNVAVEWPSVAKTPVPPMENALGCAC
jgi:hypothetical protein